MDRHCEFRTIGYGDKESLLDDLLVGFHFYIHFLLLMAANEASVLDLSNRSTIGLPCLSRNSEYDQV